jgi:hypothetical protein
VLDTAADEIAGFTCPATQDFEQGKREAGIITLQVIARGLGTTMSELLRRL